MAAFNNLILLVGRIFIAGLFLYDGVLVVRDIEGTLDYMAAFGLPGFLLLPVIALQLAGGLLVLIGWQTRWAALAFSGFTLLTALIFHANFGDPREVLHFGKDIAISGGFLFLFVAGPGAYSLDGK